MAYGEAIGRIGGSFYEPGSQGQAKWNLIGGVADLGLSFIQNKRDQDMAEAAMAYQTQLAQAQYNLAAKQAADEAAIRQRVLQRASELDYAMKTAMAKLGTPAMVNAADIQQNYNTFYNQAREDMDRTVSLVASKGQADAIRRGMDRSTQRTDQEAELVRKTAQSIPQLQQAAWDAAIARSRGYADTLNYGRDAVYNDISTAYGAAANLEKGMITNNAPSYMQTAYNNSADIASGAAARASDSQTYLGTAVGNFTERVAPNVGYAVTGNGSFVDPNAQRLLDLEQENARLRAVRGTTAG